MGEKGLLLDKDEDIFADLAEQEPQFWLDYKQYMEKGFSCPCPAHRQATRLLPID